MAFRNIVKEGNEALRKKCKKIEKITPRIHMLLDDMAETMHTADGVGLAAPQVGVLKRVVVVDVGKGVVEFINPEIIEMDGEQTGEEGCLSVPGRSGIVTRPMRVKVKALDRDGNEFVLEAEKLFARAICHEVDHLDGILFIDKMAEEIFEDDEDDEFLDEEE